MNWYKTIIAADTNDYLMSIGKDNSDIEKIIYTLQNMQREFDPRKRILNFYVNEFRKNPFLSFEELFKIPLPQKIKRNPLVNPSPREVTFMNLYTRGMGPWALRVSVEKWRQETGLTTYEEENINRYYGFLSSTATRANNLGIMLHTISDWYGRSGERIDINGLTYQQALDRALKWHAEMAVKGEGKYYKNKIIVHGPKWINPDTGEEEKQWEGWTMQEVKDDDLAVEGNKMNNCVSSYKREVEEENTRIFSLRDPNNEPHVTIETSPDIKYFLQIYGNSNSEPKDIYKEMTKAWVKSFGDDRYINPDEMYYNEWGDMPYHYHLEEMNGVIDRIGTTQGNEYGLLTHSKQSDDYNIEDMIEELLRQSEREMGGSDYRGDITYSPEKLVDAMVRLGSDHVDKLKEDLYLINDKYEEDFFKYWNYEYPNYPNPDDYEDDKEHEEAVEKWQEESLEAESEEMAEYRGQHAPLAFVDDALKYLKVLEEKWGKEALKYLKSIEEK